MATTEEAPPKTVGIVSTPHGRAATGVGVVQGIIIGYLVAHFHRRLGINEEEAVTLAGALIAFMTRLATALSVKFGLQM